MQINYKNMSAKIILVTVILFAFHLHAFSQNVIIKNERTSQIINQNFKYLNGYDSLSFESIRKMHENTFKHADTTVAFSQDQLTYWLHFNIINKADDEADLFLKYNKWSYVDFYYRNTSSKKWNHLKTGHLINQNQRAYSLADENLIPVTLNQNDTINCYVKLKADYNYFELPANLNFTVSSKLLTLQEEASTRYWIGIFLGIFLVMILYNLFVYATTHDINYLWYIAILVFQLVTLVVNFGYILDIFPSYSTIQGPVDVTLSSLFGLTIIAFTNSFLKTKYYIPFWNKMLKFIGWILVFIPFITFINNAYTAYNLSSLTGLVLFLIIIVVISISVKKEVPSAKIFLIGFLSFIAGLITFLLYTLNALPEQALFQYSMQIGSSGMVVLFAIALGNRLNILKKENEQAQQKIIEQLEENQQLQTKVNRELEEKVQERTKEIESKNKELTSMNEKITQHNEEIMAQRDQIAEQNDRINEAFKNIESKNQKIVSSINYARRIQSIILPSDEKITSAFNEIFILYKPKDIVSGDFYWFQENDGKQFLAAVDCTGHGVPGAFMSLLADGYLNQIVNLNNVHAPDKILNKMNQFVHNQLKQDETNNRDGMDMAIAQIDQKSGTLQFAGAKNPLICIKDGELIQYKGDRYSIGGIKKRNIEFTNNEISLADEGMYYMYSDGFPDQFGGKDNRKFMSKHFKNLLWEISNEPCDKQKQLLEQKLQEWQGDHPQNDDILVIGFRI